jgi:hypothetical protein
MLPLLELSHVGVHLVHMWTICLRCWTCTWWYVCEGFQQFYIEWRHQLLLEFLMLWSSYIQVSPLVKSSSTISSLYVKQLLLDVELLLPTRISAWITVVFHQSSTKVIFILRVKFRSSQKCSWMVTFLIAYGCLLITRNT